MSKTIFVVRAKQISGACIVYRTRSRLHYILTPFRLFFIGFVSVNSEKTEMETWSRETSIGDPCSDSTVLDPELGPKGARRVRAAGNAFAFPVHGKPTHDGVDRDENEPHWQANDPVRVI
jgi:hypothetical protein